MSNNEPHYSPSNRAGGMRDRQLLAVVGVGIGGLKMRFLPDYLMSQKISICMPKNSSSYNRDCLLTGEKRWRSPLSPYFDSTQLFSS